MSKTHPIPDGCEGIITHLVVDNATAAIDYYVKALGAKELMRAPTPDGSKLMHAELQVGSSRIYLSDDFPEFGGKSRTPKALGGATVTIHQYVADADAAIKRMSDAGGTVTMPAADMFWGDRYGKVTDPYGHEWGFATHIKDVTPEEMAKAAEEMFSGAPQG